MPNQANNHNDCIHSEWIQMECSECGAPAEVACGICGDWFCAQCSEQHDAEAEAEA
jgi:hypothetical protein